MGELVTKSGQYIFDLHVEKEVEVDGVGMGVLNDGTAYLNARGLARMCGIDHTLILRLGEQWGSEREQPRVRKIRETLRQQGVNFDKPYIETLSEGVVHHAYYGDIPVGMLPASFAEVAAVTFQTKRPK